MLIRPATNADWPAIWPFFRDIVEAGETYALPAGLSSDEAAPLWFAPGFTVLVAVDDAPVDDAPGAAPRVLGSAKYGPNRDGRGAHVATGSFMVAPEAAGLGVGRALGEHVVDAARRDGFRSMQFNAVVATNTRAVALWESLGFETLAVVPEAFEHPAEGFVGLHVMYRRL
ncbi:Mycothiol acetyltransferase [Frondihabitans sp. 762G35]|uniref:GNAT family N-acetyltransferase n=1 Tax=Frondihabitans sp. 762G35 TaxID=1446794 RepID=UPI000D21B1E8|nr:GNAT family N-acetyltransferase [Frondihabitans sp. 762G35]ARC56105.1 Mycothiol acetyltransferase [Frondihabitans sp. 762G35]